MNSKDNISLVLLPASESGNRVTRMRTAMAEAGIDCALIRDLTNIYYMTGRVFSGYIFMSVDPAVTLYCLRRPTVFEGDGIVKFHSVKELYEALKPYIRGKIGLELDRMSYNGVARLQKAFGGFDAADLGPIIRAMRAVKTPYEVDKVRRSAMLQTRVYERVPGLYEPGMSDIELQIEIERLSRLEGCLGQFRVGGDEMEIFMGNVLTGDNADTPSPYDFAMGGEGLDPSIPVGANGTIIMRDKPVMVDMNGNFCGYMSDMTRCYCAGHVSPEARHAYDTSVEICRRIAAAGRPGVEAKTLYEIAENTAAEAGLSDYFMGYTSHAGFVGHGLGIEVNEAPVLAPRSRDVLQAGNVIALEPKFVIPGIGAIGIENTYVVRDGAPMEQLTLANEDIMELG